jgi:hypothetical protein
MSYEEFDSPSVDRTTEVEAEGFSSSADTVVATDDVSSFVSHIDELSTRLKSEASDAEKISMINTVAQGLRDRVEAVCSSGKWKDKERLRRDIDKMQHTVTQELKSIGKSERRNEARGKSKVR